MGKVEWTANIKKTFNKIIKSRTFKYGTNSIVLIAVVIAITVIVNILVDTAGVKWDLTPTKIYSIGDTTKNILENLDKDVIIYGLFDETRLSSTSQDKEFVDLLEQYAKYPHVQVKYVDPDKNPGILNEIDPDDTLGDVSKSVFIVKSGNKLRALSYYDLFSTYFDESTFQTYITGSAAESGFTGAIKYVTAEYTPVIYFTTGHDEKKVDDNFSYLKQQLINNNFEIKTVNLMIEQKIPEDAEILVVSSPQKDLTIPERDLLKDYFENGGNVIFMFDYLEMNPQFPQFENVLMEFNLGLNYDKVKENDESKHWPQNPYIILTELQSNQVISENYGVIFPNSRSINILKNVKEYINTIPLATTSEQAVGEQIDKNKGNDIPGPLNIAVAVLNEGWYQPSKIAVIGSSAFVDDSSSDTLGPYFNNSLVFFLDIVDWMYEAKEDTVISPKTYSYQYINITAAQANYVAVGVVGILPLTILGIGVFVFLRRRHL